MARAVPDPRLSEDVMLVLAGLEVDSLAELSELVRVGRAHMDDCHICHLPKDQPGGIFCSYPHPLERTVRA